MSLQERVLKPHPQRDGTGSRGLWTRPGGQGSRDEMSVLWGEATAPVSPPREDPGRRWPLPARKKPHRNQTCWHLGPVLQPPDTCCVILSVYGISSSQPQWTGPESRGAHAQASSTRSRDGRPRAHSSHSNGSSASAQEALCRLRVRVYWAWSQRHPLPSTNQNSRFP